MRLFNANETDYTYNGLGFLTDVISAEVYEEINGEYVLNVEYLLNGMLSDQIEREKIIVCKVADGSEQPFRIKYIDRNFKTMLIKAYHISYDLADDLLINVAPTNLNAQAFGRWLLNNSTSHAQEYTFNSSIATLASARYIRKNVLESMLSTDENSMLNKFGGEFERDGFTLTLKTRLGADNGVKLLVGKNIQEIQITIDDTSLYTRICPVGYGGLTIPEIYVDSPLVNEYPFPKACVITFDNIKYDETGEDPEAYDNLPDFYDALRAAAAEMFTQGLDKPLINVAVNWIDLAKTKEYENFTSLETIRLGDTLTCDMQDFQFTTRVIATTYNVLLDRITNFEIGKTIASIASTMNITIKEVESQDTSSLLEQAQQNASNMLKNAMTGYIYFDYDNGNLYIMDNPDPDDAVKVWRWNLNGLGYSSTGINGTYGLAITMDGSIVADYITTGTLNTNVIQGYDSLVSSVEKIEDLTIRGEAIGTAQINGASANTPYSFIIMAKIAGDISYTYPSNNLYPSDTTYMQDRILRFTNRTTNEVFDYTLPCDLLNYSANRGDSLELVGTTRKYYKNKYVDYDSSGNKIYISPAIKEYYDIPYIPLSRGNYQIAIASQPNAYILMDLIKENDITNVFAGSIQQISSITQAKNEMEAKVATVADTEGEITAASIKLAINNDTSLIKLKGDQIALEGTITANRGFMIDLDGNMTCNNANINGDIITQKGVLTNLQFGCESWGWNNPNVFSGSSGGFCGFNYAYDNNNNITIFKSYVNFSAHIPENFTIKKATLYLRHSPMKWLPPAGSDYQDGSCKNMQVYEANGLGQTGYGAYYSFANIGGNEPYLNLLTTTPASLSFSDSQFEEKTIDLPIEVFSSKGTHNIVVQTTDEIPTGVDYANAYQKLGSKTGILTGTLEIIGYTNNV